MKAIASLFRGSPFLPLQSHMERVVECVHKMESLFEAYTKNDYDRILELAKEVSKLEHMADLTKNEIRNNLPRGIFLAINRADLLNILSLQDTIADKAEDTAILFTLKKLEPLPGMQDDLKKFMDKNIQSVDETHQILRQLNELLEVSFGGKEAELVSKMVDNVALLEHEVDLIQADLLRKLFALEDSLPYTSFYLWTHIFRTMAALSNTAEKLANRVRMILEIK
ncbi:MAG TPA: TIGR00153 family protein [Caldithrix abyssi]|uniref:TIGR00153 family protein n=1 Tax=Caldithrix abyssi TaxID=187145 RepID=A0A7V5PRH5_CALAY|nr:TIGR00153 family protein [Caldithrix abyssi]